MGHIVSATDGQNSKSRQVYLQKLAAMKSAAAAATQRVASEPAPAPKTKKPAPQPVIGTIRIRDGHGTRTVAVTAISPAEPSSILRAPQFGLRGKTFT